MNRLELAGVAFEYDRDATLAAYAGIPAGGAQSCRCTPCVNWLALGEAAFPPGFRSLLDCLGVPFDRAAEAYHMCRLPSGLHSYGGWFHFVGIVRGSGHSVKTSGLHFCPFGREGFPVGVRTDAALVPEPFAGRPVIQLDFVAEVPWVLNSPEPD